MDETHSKIIRRLGGGGDALRRDASAGGRRYDSKRQLRGQHLFVGGYVADSAGGIDGHQWMDRDRDRRCDGPVQASARGYNRASDGNRSIDLDGRSARGGLEQIIATEIGHTYRLTFDVAGNTDGNAFGSGLRTMDVLAIGASTQSASFGFDCTGQSHWDMGWMSMEWSFVADAPSTTLRFLSTTTATPAGYGMTLDNVAIHAPAPTAALLALLGLGSSGGLLARCRRRVA